MLSKIKPNQNPKKPRIQLAAAKKLGFRAAAAAATVDQAYTFATATTWAPYNSLKSNSREERAATSKQKTHTHTPLLNSCKIAASKACWKRNKKTHRAPTLTTESTINRHTSKLKFLRLPSSSPTSGPLGHTVFSLSLSLCVSLSLSLPVSLLSVGLSRKSRGKARARGMRRDCVRMMPHWQTDGRTGTKKDLCSSSFFYLYQHLPACPPARNLASDSFFLLFLFLFFSLPFFKPYFLWFFLCMLRNFGKKWASGFFYINTCPPALSFP